MPRMTVGKRSELESFWRAHSDGWRRSELNHRENCALHGLPLKRLGNWRAKLKHEVPTTAGKLLYRRGGELSHMASRQCLSLKLGGVDNLVRPDPRSYKLSVKHMGVTHVDFAAREQFSF